MFAIWSPLWLLAAVWTWQRRQRRRAFQDFAAAQHLEFVGTIPSDARSPYTRFGLVRWAVLLFNVLEGQWDGLPICLFDMPHERRSPHWTTILVTVEGTLRRGAGAERAIASEAPGWVRLRDSAVDVLIETSAEPSLKLTRGLDVLCVSPRRLLDASELAAWLSFATTLAKAMERDAKEDAPIEASEASIAAPPMFSMFSGE